MIACFSDQRVEESNIVNESYYTLNTLSTGKKRQRSSHHILYDNPITFLSIVLIIKNYNKIVLYSFHLQKPAILKIGRSEIISPFALDPLT